MIQISPETQLFIREHSSDDVRTLALQAKKYPDINMPTAITQIAGRQVAAEKIPSWREIEEIWYPKHLSLEQCSSEITARYKARLFQGDSLTDLTGGFGIDCSFLATGFKSATYVERQEELCEIAAHNFPILNLNHINVRNEDGVAYLQTMSPVDCIFLDPARRNEHGGKTVLKELKHTQEVHILSVNNECKELLILLGQTSPAEITIHCVNLFTKGTQEEQHFVFTREQEQRSQCTYTDSLGDYLYEPNASLLKAGAFRSIAAAYPVRKLHPNSHLYTSDTFIENFPGRIFRIVNQCSFNKKEVKENLADLKKANVTVRNFPATVAELRKRLHLTEGGDTYLFASTLNNGQKVIIRCEKV
ncbi:MAG: SAM-dependent methyltransferase [Bacteroides sp.]|nr:SAM-dependent methyltransferase [Bacteroides sp.]